MAAWSDWSLAELKGFRKNLAKAIATGADNVAYGDRRVQYRSLADMRSTLQALDGEIAAREGGTRSRQIRVRSRKGFT